MTERIYTREEILAAQPTRTPEHAARVKEAMDWVFKNHASLFKALADDDARDNACKELTAARRALVTFLAYRR